MWDFLERLFDPTGFPARWHCGLWTPGHGYLHIVSDLAIFGAYTAIPLLLAWVVWKRREDVPFPPVFWLFVAFILCCGVSHAVEAMIFWHPLYRLAGAVKFATAVVSWATVIVLVPTLPRAFALRSPRQLEAVVADRTRALARANATLQEKREELEAMMRMVSHDLRSPLVTTSGFLGVLRDELGDQAAQPGVADALGRIDRAQGRMGRLIDDLLSLSRFGVASVARRELDLGALVEETAAGLELEAERRGARLVTDTAAKVRLVGDPDRLARAVDNLIRNALVHGCPEAGHQVTVRVEPPVDSIAPRTGLRLARRVDVVVEDDGPGIATADREAVFEPFARRSKAEGSGIGLAIVARVARDHGGSARVEERPGGGARFVMTLETAAPRAVMASASSPPALTESLAG